MAAGTTTGAVVACTLSVVGLLRLSAGRLSPFKAKLEMGSSATLRCFPDFPQIRSKRSLPPSQVVGACRPLCSPLHSHPFLSTGLRFAVLVFRLFGWFSLASKQGPVCTVKSRSACSWHVGICRLLRKVSNQFKGFRSGLGQKVLAAGPLELDHCSRSRLSLTTSSRREMFCFPSAFSHSRVSLCEVQAREMIWRSDV